jgi:hypothetical protein
MATILAANIGTSDIAIKIGNYYIPIGFDRSEPNIDYSGLDKEEEEASKQEFQQKQIVEYLCPELGVEVKTDNNGRKSFSFLELTKKILESYEADEKTWHERIRTGRIWGVIQSAVQEKFQTREVYFFVTDQPHNSDTIYLFDILEKWFKREFPELTLNKRVIPQDIPANNQDALLNYYYHFFNEIKRRNIILTSIKGGTPQMQTALRIQAIASGFPKLLFIDPKLSVKKVLAGEASECQLTSYWRYMKTQKYQSVKLLLEERWDFDGAKQILNDWNKLLKFLHDKQINEEVYLSNAEGKINKVIQALNLGVNYLNLDYESTSIDINPELASDTTFKAWINNRDEGRLLNIYTQCRIYWDMNQIANFLARMSSFYELTLERLIFVLNGAKFFREDRSLNISLICQEVEDELWQSFYKDQQQYNPKLKDYHKNPQGVRLDSRLAKRNFIDKLLIPHSGVERRHWIFILESLESLDFWAEQRNNLIHYSTGVSKQQMQDLWHGRDKSKDRKTALACDPNKIRSIMAQICQSELGLLQKPLLEQFVGKNSSFYLYSEIQQWVINNLNDDSQI